MLLPILRDIVKHTAALGFIETLKVTGTETETLVESVNPAANLILKARLNEPCPALNGTFGMNNLSVLSGYVEFPSFRADTAVVEIKRRTRQGEEVPEKIVFSDGQGQAFNFRLMSKEVVQAQPELPNINWAVEFVPQKGKVEEFRRLAQILSGVHREFIPRTVDGTLVFFIGGENTATHDGRMVFETDIKGKFTTPLAWQIPSFLTLLKLSDQHDITIRFSEQGLLAVSLNSGSAEYTYILGGKDVS